MVAVAIAAAVLSTGGVAGATSARSGHRVLRTAAPACSTRTLVVWLYSPIGGETAGSAYYDVEFTNLSARTCTLRGYPGVSAVDLSGRELGTPAARNTTAVAASVAIAPGASAMAVLRLTDVGNFPAGSCHQVTAAGLRVYPPGQTTAKVVPYPFAACGRNGERFLSVGAVQRTT